MHDSIIEESVLEAQLSEGIMRNELRLFYQPKVSLETGEVILHGPARELAGDPKVIESYLGLGKGGD